MDARSLTHDFPTSGRRKVMEFRPSRDAAEAEDAVQETYLKAFLHLDEFRGDAAIGTWLCRIVMNEALGRLRRRRPMVDWSTMEENGKPSAEIIRLPVGTTPPDPERATSQR